MWKTPAPGSTVRYVTSCAGRQHDARPARRPDTPDVPVRAPVLSTEKRPSQTCHRVRVTVVAASSRVLPFARSGGSVPPPSVPASEPGRPSACGWRAWHRYALSGWLWTISLCTHTASCALGRVSIGSCDDDSTSSTSPSLVSHCGSALRVIRSRLMHPGPAPSATRSA
jgi:hypothetical protein